MPRLRIDPVTYLNHAASNHTIVAVYMYMYASSSIRTDLSTAKYAVSYSNKRYIFIFTCLSLQNVH